MNAKETPKILNNNSFAQADNNLSMATEDHQNSHLLIVEDDQGRKEFTLIHPIYTIGRDKNSDIRLISQFVSRRHATLVRLTKQDKPESYYYRILDGDGKGKSSVNGLMINGRKMPYHDLQNEDEVVFGPQVKAIYYLLSKESDSIGHIDSSEYDITLINPGMTEDFDD